MTQPHLDSSSNPPQIERIVIIAHAPQTARRLAWRFAETAFLVKSYDYTEAAADTAVVASASLLLVDLGWSEAELEQSLDFLFQATRGDRRPKIVALVPRLSGQSRPDWAELGVTLALDSTTPPPEIAEAVLKILQNVNLNV